MPLPSDAKPLGIGDYALIGNTHTAALVGRNGSIDWLSVPRFDGPACFAAILGGPQNGRWQIAPREEVRAVERRYRPETLVLETHFRTASGEVLLIDFMPRPRESGTVEVVRIVRGVSGSVPMRLEAIIRCDYGKTVPWVRRRDYGISAIAGPDALQLRTRLPLEGKDNTTVADFTLREGETVPSTLTWCVSNGSEPGERDPEEALGDTEAFWREWVGVCQVDSDWREPVVRSLITLKALTYSPTGGIVAAPTTSLPERIGGMRNWDYRFCWLRDATFTLYALLITGYREEAREWREWLLRAVAGEPANMQIMYGLSGERRLWEHELPWLGGHRGSKPVRIGNAAHEQRQIDVYGEVMDAFHLGRKHGIESDDDTWRVQRVLLEFLEGEWEKPDSSLWEVRGPERRYTHSAVMAWVAADRAVKAVEKFGFSSPVERWRSLRERIRDDVCRNGFDAERNTFVQYYGGKGVDAALLMLPLVGFLRPEDPRMAGTVRAIEQELMVDGFVQRYITHPHVDGLPPGEGVFLACSFWYADNLVLLGREEEAQRLFERLLSIRNDVGLLSEEYDPRTRELLGNFPQAFSHVGLINTAHNLSLRRGPAKQRADH
ncbi:MAG TPA: glycoside hydrolase family 15 protein [Stellaceae bacterium]|nr:glycoside hydrolase family 15 protein [Stellaceae bacterium]